MDPSTSSASQVQRGSANRNQRPSDKDGGDHSKSHPHRTLRYKDKFQIMREKFDLVTSLNESYKHQLEMANGKMKDLQAENNLLLDAMNIVAEKIPIYSYLPENQQLEQPAPHPEQPYPPHPPSEYRQHESAPRRGRSQSHSSHINGSNGYSNGTRHRPIEPPYDPQDDASSTEYPSRSANGR